MGEPLTIDEYGEPAEIPGVSDISGDSEAWMQLPPDIAVLLYPEQVSSLVEYPAVLSC